MLAIPLGFDLQGVTPEMLHGDISEIVKHVTPFDHSTFHAADIAPAGDLPAHHVAAAMHETATAATPPVPESAFHAIDPASPDSPFHAAESRTAQYIADHHVQYDATHHLLAMDSNGDGTIAPQEIIYDFSKSVPLLDHSEMQVDASGNLVVNLFDANNHLLGIWTWNTVTESAALVPPVESIAHASSGFEIQGSSWRFAETMTRQLKNYIDARTTIFSTHGSDMSPLSDMHLQEAITHPSSVIDVIKKIDGLTAREQNSLQKPLLHMLKMFAKNKVPFHPDATIGAALTNASHFGKK
mgnify:CR=1 FL=1